MRKKELADDDSGSPGKRESKAGTRSPKGEAMRASTDLKPITNYYTSGNIEHSNLRTLFPLFSSHFTHLFIFSLIR